MTMPRDCCAPLGSCAWRGSVVRDK
jgi:hypothetical protein